VAKRRLPYGVCERHPQRTALRGVAYAIAIEQLVAVLRRPKARLIQDGSDQIARLAVRLFDTCVIEERGNLGAQRSDRKRQ
jgi:hypothetical protein